MPYYPLSQIKTNLYTNGDEFILNPNNPNTTYIGYYWKTSDGKINTGRNPQDVNVQPLYPKFPINFNNIPDIATSPNYNYIAVNGGFEVFGGDNSEGGEEEVNKYIILNNINPSEIQTVATYNPQLPTQQDYQIGEFRRYFCKKTNEYLFIEINQTQYTQLSTKNPQILWQLYQPFYLDWQLIGDKQQVYKVNRNNTELTITTLKLRGLNEYLKFDYIKYYQ